MKEENITPSLDYLSNEELLSFIQHAVQLISHRQQDEQPPIVDNLFELIDERGIQLKDFLEPWKAHYNVWQRMRRELKKLSVERIAILSRVLDVPPAYLFQLILDSYPKKEGSDEEYDFTTYRDEVKRRIDEDS